jgi:hypothetical protein
MAIARHEVEFTKDGTVHDETQVDALLGGLAGVTDLLVLCHGWNNDMKEARELYDELVGNFEKLLDIRETTGAPAVLGRLKGRTFATCEVLWPSKKFADSDLIPGGGAASATGASDAAATRALEALKHDPDRLGQKTVSPARAAAVDKAKALLPQLEQDAAARREYVQLLRGLLNHATADADDGAREFFTADPEQLFKNLNDAVVAPAPARPGGATSLGNAGGAAGFGDMVQGVGAAARRLANIATYYQMKSRAGTIGSEGLSKVLRRCRTANPGLKQHLVGHSFGGRVVTAAANVLDPDTAAVTVTLLQAAFSHNGLSDNFDEKGTAGFFRSILSKRRVSGPIIITHTKNDTAIGVAYPLVSRIANQMAAALGDQNDPYGGMGRNGAQRTPEAAGNATQLAAVGGNYTFSPGKIHNLLADDIIHDHGDVRSIQVAYAVLSAADAV